MTIVGARPQFIKAAAFARALKRHEGATIKHVLVHTGQHYDDMMSDVFFRELDIGQPDHNCEGCTPVAHETEKRVMSLPLSAHLSADSLRSVINALEASTSR